MKSFRNFLVGLLILVLLVSGPTTLYAKDNKREGHRIRIETASQNEGLEKEIRERIRTKSQFTSETTEDIKKHERKKYVKKFVAYGELIAFDQQTITVFVTRATRNGKDLVGKEATFHVDLKTRIRLNKKLNQLKDLIGSGIRVSIKGYSDGERLVASRVFLKLPSKVVINGTVSSVFDGGFTVKVKTCNKAIFHAGEEVKVLTGQYTKWTVPSTTTASLKAGASVQVFGFEKEKELLATRVVIKAKPSEKEVTQEQETTSGSELNNEEKEAEITEGNTATDNVSSNLGETTSAGNIEEQAILQAVKNMFNSFIETLEGILARLF